MAILTIRLSWKVPSGENAVVLQDCCRCTWLVCAVDRSVSNSKPHTLLRTTPVQSSRDRERLTRGGTNFSAVVRPRCLASGHIIEMKGQEATQYRPRETRTHSRNLNACHGPSTISAMIHCRLPLPKYHYPIAFPDGCITALEETRNSSGYLSYSSDRIKGRQNIVSCEQPVYLRNSQTEIEKPISGGGRLETSGCTRRRRLYI